jgi:hypothetical protein
VFFSKETNKPPMKFEKWINDYSLSKNQFQWFIKQKYPLAEYGNLYNKDTGMFVKQIKF